MDCLFCKIIAKQIPAKFDLEEKDLIAIQDIHPQAPVHSLIIPREHIPMIDDLEERNALLIGRLIEAAKRLAKQKKIEGGYRLVFNNGALAGQSVFHIHLHLLGGRKMNWPPG